jgi:hypothetical protein
LPIWAAIETTTAAERTGWPFIVAKHVDERLVDRGVRGAARRF